MCGLHCLYYGGGGGGGGVALALIYGPIQSLIKASLMDHPDKTDTSGFTEGPDLFWVPSSIDSIFYEQMKAKQFRELSARDIL